MPKVEQIATGRSSIFIKIGLKLKILQGLSPSFLSKMNLKLKKRQGVSPSFLSKKRLEIENIVRG